MVEFAGGVGEGGGSSSSSSYFDSRLSPSFSSRHFLLTLTSPLSSSYSSLVQGYLNAALNGHKIPVTDYGYRYNYVGSFENMNRHKLDLRAEEAYVVHATTGLLFDEVEVEAASGETEEWTSYRAIVGDEANRKREVWLREVDGKWKERRV